MNDIRDFSMEQFQEFVINQVKQITDIELLILKGHILVEYALNCYLESLSKLDKSDFFKDRFTFWIKVNMARHFGHFSKSGEVLFKGLSLLNQLRNQIAHTLSYSEPILQELYNETSKNMKPRTNELTSSQQKLITSIIFICGALFSLYKFSTDKDGLEEFLGKNKSA